MSKEQVNGNVIELLYIHSLCQTVLPYNIKNRNSYMSAHVLLNVLNELGKRDKVRGLPSILSLFRDEFNIFNDTGARMLDSIYHIALRLL